MRKFTESDLFLNQKRAIRFYKKNFKKNKSKSSKSKSTNRAKYKSLIISLLRKPSKNNFRSNFRPREEIKLPETFSVIHDPEGFLKTINMINLKNTEKLREIFIDHSKVKKLDLAAESILDLIVMELKRSKRSHQQIKVSGVLPDDPEMDRYVRAIGIVKNLNIKDKCLDSEHDDSLRIIKMRNKRHYSKSSEGTGWKERAVKDFVKHINTCLRDHGKRLTKIAEGKLASYTGEILNNAEDHSGHDESTIVGYLDNASPMHICEISIFNFGKTIADTFHDIPRNSYTWVEISDYLETHIKKRWFSYEWSKNDLFTLVALQGHISSKNFHKEQDRGQGTVDLIEFFQQIHRSCFDQESSIAEMAILSGNTHIYFDGKYKMTPDNTGRKVIAFNDNNDLSQKPDSKYVRSLVELSFPGTIISIRFPMKSESTEPYPEQNNE